MADSEEKLCRLVSEFGRVCESRKFRVNVGKSSYEVIEVWNWVSNACETKLPTIRGSGLFEGDGRPKSINNVKKKLMQIRYRYIVGNNVLKFQENRMNCF